MRKNFLKALAIVGAAVLCAASGQAAQVGLTINISSNSVTFMGSNGLGNAGTVSVVMGTTDAGGSSTSNWAQISSSGSISAAAWFTNSYSGLSYGGNYYANVVIADATGATNVWLSTGNATNFTIGAFSTAAGTAQPVSQWPTFILTNSTQVASTVFTNNSTLLTWASNINIIVNNLNSNVNQIATNLLKFPLH